MSRRRYQPRCPVCRYDLSGSADGPCPECGNRFRHAELRAAWEARERSRPKLSGHEALYVAAFLALPPCCLMDEPLSYVAVPLMWVLTAVWCVQQWDRLTDDRAYWSLWILLACLRTPVGMDDVAAVRTIAEGWAIVSAAAVLLFSFIRAPLQSGAILFAAIAAVFLPFGLLAMLQGSSGVAAGHYWGPLDRPKGIPYLSSLGPSHVRAMTNAGVLWVGLTSLLVGSIAATIAGLFTWPLRKRLKAALQAGEETGAVRLRRR